MRRTIVAAALILLPIGSGALAGPPLSDPVTLNIGFVCQWQQRCMAQQKGAMKRSLKFVRKYQPPVWRVEVCNHNAARNRYRVDWIGFENCIRNTALPPLPARSIIVVKKRPRRLTQSSPPSPPSSFGERG